jgi:protein-tyrosine phosphatase
MYVGNPTFTFDPYGCFMKTFAAATTLRPSLHPSERAVTFEQVFNVRDLGGLNVPGGRLRRGCLYRGATLHRASESDANALEQRGIRTVVDLRTSEELKQWSGHGHWSPTRVVHAPLLRTPWDRADVEADHDATSFLAARYLEMLTGNTEAMVRTIETLADASGHAALYHCAAGKDRTGVVTAVLLGLLGVDEQTIVEDYHYTSLAMKDLFGLFALDGHYGGVSMVDQPAAFLAAPREAMELTLRALRLDWGSIGRYALSIGVPSDASSDCLAGGVKRISNELT